MTYSDKGISLRTAALISGYGLLLMMISFILTDALILQKLIIAGDTTATMVNISNNITLFRTGICGLIIVIFLDILVSWSLYILLIPVNKNLALLMGWWRLVYSVIFAAALVNYFEILHILQTSDFLQAYQPQQLQSLMQLSLDSFTDMWHSGFIFFGLHLLFLGYLVFKADYFPKYLGILLMLSGLSYLIDYLGKFLLAGIPLGTSLVGGWFELILMIWLIIKGSKLKSN